MAIAPGRRGGGTGEKGMGKQGGWGRSLESLVLVVVMLWGLVACGPVPTDRQNQVVISVLSDPKTFNPVLSQESPNPFGLTYEGLVRQNPLTGEVEPDLAESWTISPDGLSLTFTLRPGLRWSDGQPLTVEDVLFTYGDLYLNSAIPNSAQDILRIGEGRAFPKVEAVGDRQVKFTIPEPFAPFLTTMGLPIMPAHALGESVRQKDANGRPKFFSIWGVTTPPQELVGNGRYRLTGYQTGQRLIFEANPHYWEKDNQGQSLPRIPKVIWEIVGSLDTALLQFRSGDLDLIGVAPPQFSLLKREEKRGKFTIYNGGPDYGTSFIAFNLNTAKRNGKPLVPPHKSRWFRNQKFRQAIAHAIDRQRMINNIYRGLGEVQNSPISVQSPFYAKDVPAYDYQPEKAKQLLREAGFRYSSDGKLEDDQGNPVRFSLITNAGNTIREDMGVQIQQDLAKLGIQVDYNPISFNVLVEKLDSSLDWECHLLGLTGGNEPNDGSNVWNPEGSLHLFNQKPAEGKDKITDWQVSDWERRIGDLYIQGARELDREKRKAIYAETQRIAQEQLPFIHLVNDYALGAVRDRIQGVQYSALDGALWNIERLRLTDY